MNMPLKSSRPKELGPGRYWSKDVVILFPRNVTNHNGERGEIWLDWGQHKL